MSKYIDDTGLAHFWASLKTIIGGKLDKSGGVLTGETTAKSPTTGTLKLRNVGYGTSEPSSSDGAVGDVFIVLEV